MPQGEISMSDHKMVLTAVGPDRPGLVHEISSVIHAAGANLEDSRMAVLAGDFALIVLFSGSEEVMEQVQRDSTALEGELDFSIRFKPASPRLESESHRDFALDVTGVDQPGIVQHVSEVLAGLDVNVTSFESRLSVAAFHGTPMFTLLAELEVPNGSELDTLHERLEQVCEQLHLSYDLSSLKQDP
jgi:glycine cleavage system transcriptional repressor